MTTVIIVKRHGVEYLRSLLRDGQPVVVDKSIRRSRAMEIVAENEGNGRVEGELDFGERPCEWVWEFAEEALVLV